MIGKALSVASCLVALWLAMSPPAVLAADAYPAQTIAKEQRCPVCGMYPARFPKWMSQVVFRDNTTAAADSPTDLFRFLHNMAKYDRKHTAKDIGAIYFTDYAKGGWVSSAQAFFVGGSKAAGPMNQPDLPAFSSRESAEKFARDNGGKVLAFDEITPAVVAALGKDEDGQHSHHTH